MIVRNLPKVETIKYDAFIKELDKTIKYRPFTVREHKLLLQAIELKDEKALVNTILDIVNACTFEELEIEKVPSYIVDYLYLLIHSRSVGSTQIANYVCNNMILRTDEDTEKEVVERCGGNFQIKIDMDRAEIVYPEEYDSRKVVMIDDEVGIKFRVPNFEVLKKIDLKDTMVDLADDFIYACVESIFSNAGVFTPGVDFDQNEMVEWMNDLDGSTVEKMSQFFKDLPYVGLTLPITCPKCGKKETIQLKGLEDFFD